MATNNQPKPQSADETKAIPQVEKGDVVPATHGAKPRLAPAPLEIKEGAAPRPAPASPPPKPQQDKPSGSNEPKK